MKHTHRYQRVNLASLPGKTYLVYRCTLPDCNHYIRPELLFGKKCNCYKCGKDFIVSKSHYALAPTKSVDATGSNGHFPAER